MGLFSLLNVGTRGLSAAQLSMDVAGQNISNADVEGYSRKRLNLNADYRMDGSFGQMGFGVEVESIERVRNTLIDSQIQRQNHEVGMYTEIDQTLQRVESIFVEPSATGIQHFIDQFFDSWQNLANNPADVASRTMVKTNAEILSNVFHSLSGELRDLGQSRNTEIGVRVKRVNELSQEIFNLNNEIMAIEINKQNANDSRDKRDQLLKEIATLVDTDVVENEYGQVTVITGGSIIVSPVGFQKLELTTNSFVRSDGTNGTDVGLRFADSKLICNLKGGQIKGLFESRDIIIPAFEVELDTLANALVTKINQLHETGYNQSGYSGMQFFNPAGTGASDISLSASIISSIQNIAAASGGVVSANGPLGSLAATHTFGGPLFNLGRRNIVMNSVEVQTPTGTMLQENVDYHIDHVNGTLQMLHGGYDTTDLTINFNYNSGAFKGVGDNTNAVAIAQLRQQLTMTPDNLGNAQSSFTDYYSSMIGRLGLAKNEAASNLETRTFLVDQLNRQQDSIAGVSLDEEMGNIIKAQHTYQAAARLMSTTSTMLDILMTIGQ